MAKRSYFQEISELINTWEVMWNTLPLMTGNLSAEVLSGNAFCIGSGGSLSLAKMWQQIYEERGLGFARSMTPYEFHHTSTVPSIVFLFSASGKNHDILQVFKTATARGSKVVVFTLTPQSALVRLVKSNMEQSFAIYPECSVPKDGFLAVNSIVSMACLIAKLEKHIFNLKDDEIDPIGLAIQHNSCQNFESIINKTIQIVASDWGLPAGVDLETRLAESGLSNCFLTDPRNFGHGRFIWLEKHKDNSAIIMFFTPKSNKFMKRFQQTLPQSIPKIVVNSPYDGTVGAIYCLTRSILILSEIAKVHNVDPGKPEVPDWGRKLHRLRLGQSDFKQIEAVRNDNSISSKGYPALSLQLSGIVMDLDGTLVDTVERFNPVKNEISEEISRLLSEGFKIGFSTGRGKSGISLLKNVIPAQFWNEIIVGLYNGTRLVKLSDLNAPVDCDLWPLQKSIIAIIEEISRNFNKAEISARPTQITIQGLTPRESDLLLKELRAQLGRYSRFAKIQVSGHSIDILPSWGTKLSVVEAMSELSSGNILCLGDQGQLGGNDEELLSWVPSVSVGKLRPVSNACLWIGKNKRHFESKGTLVFLKAIRKNLDSFSVDMSLLDELD